MSSNVGSLLRAPDGGIEDVQEMADAGMRWLGLNIGDYQATRWDVVRERAAQASPIVECMPWARLGAPDQGATKESCLARLHSLCDTADAWGTNLMVVNAETELRDGMISTAEIANEIHGYQAAISSEANLYWAVDWSPLHRYPVHLQCFPEDGKIEPKDAATIQAWVTQCVVGARERAGFTYVAVSMQAWRSDPEWYDRSGQAWNIVFGDDVAGTGGWEAWA